MWEKKFKKIVDKVPISPRKFQIFKKLFRDKKDEDNIEIEEKQWVKYIVNIFEASDLTHQVRNILSPCTLNETEVTVNSYVKVLFSNLTAKTSMKKGTNNPKWNEKFIFTESFPPSASESFEIELRHSGKIQDLLIAKHIINLEDISESGDQGFLPTFGPSFVYLYGLEKRNSENQDEAILYKGKIFLSISTQIIEKMDKIMPNVKRENLDSEKELTKENYNVKTYESTSKELILFGCVYELSMINIKFGNKPMHLGISIGNSHLNSDKYTFIRSYTDAIIPEPTKSVINYYQHLPYNNTKPCLGGVSTFPDQRRRSYLSNSLQRIRDTLFNDLTNIETSIENEIDKSMEFKKAINNCISSIQNFIPNLHVNSGPIDKRNDLDLKRLEFIEMEIKNIKEELLELISDTDLSNTESYLTYALDLSEDIDDLVKDPQHAQPDIFIWLISDGQKIAFKRIPSRDIMFSTIEQDKGKDCGKQLTLFLEVNPENKTLYHNVIQAKLVIYLWLGLDSEKKYILDNVIDGYVKTPEIRQIGDSNVSLPECLHYSEIHEYELQAYIYQARSLMALDKAGLSDPFIRIIIQDECKTSQIKKKTLNPLWNELLTFSNIRIYGNLKQIKECPPLLTVEVLDYDSWGKDNCIGIACSRPTVKLEDDLYSQSIPILKWHDVLGYDEEPVGEILMTLQLKQMSPSRFANEVSIHKTLHKKQSVIPIPNDIRPKVCMYRLEILFWGLRDLKKLCCMKIKNSRVKIECNGTDLQSEMLNYKIRQNFPYPAKYIDLELPEQNIYRPPLTIHVIECLGFGVTSTVGVHVIKSLNLYEYEASKKIKEEEALKQDKINIMKLPTSEISRHTIIDFSNRKSVTERQYLSFNGMENDEYRDWWSRYFFARDKDKYGTEYIEKQFQNHEISLPYSRQEPPSLSALRSESLYASGNGRINEMESHSDELLQNSSRFSIEQKYQKKIKHRESYIKIYKCELEKVPEFGGFIEWLESFGLYRGKQARKIAFQDESRRVGTFKGSLIFYKLSESNKLCNPYLSPVKTQSSTYFSNVPKNNPISVLVKVYIIKAIDLKPQDINNKVDAYINIELGTKKENNKANYIPRQLNPVFGKCFTFDAVFPRDSSLLVQIYDWDLMGSDDLIGETKIDLENRLYSRHRAICGIPERYEALGCNAWRDVEKPTLILEKLCKKWKNCEPQFHKDSIKIGDYVFSFPGPYDEIDETFQENMALEVLHKWKEIAGFSLVSEHIETRTLYHPSKSEEQGKLEMWIDLFPRIFNASILERDISPRVPVKYELRVIIWNASDVKFADHSVFTGEKSSDIYIKGWIKGPKDEQETDVHYQSQTGEGNFNWRFIFPFEYYPAEKKIKSTEKTSLFTWDEEEKKIPSELKLEVWDADTFSADDYLGSLILNLNYIPRSAKTSNHCTLEMLQKNAKAAHQSIFKKPRIRGWWPVYDKNAKVVEELTGKLEIELHLLTENEALANPVGYGRKEPEPLETPKRPVNSLIDTLRPLRAIKLLIWRRYKWIILNFFIIFSIALLFILFIYNSPGYFAKKIIGA